MIRLLTNICITKEVNEDMTENHKTIEQNKSIKNTLLNVFCDKNINDINII